MAGIKISNLTAIPSSALTDIFPAVQSGVTYKTTLQQALTLFQAQATNLTGVTGVITFPTAITGATTTMAVRTNVNAGDTVTLRAYDVNGAAYTTFGTLTANNDPTFVLTGASVTNIPNTGLTIMDTDATHALSIVPGSNLTAARALSIVTGDADRSITLTGNLAMSGAFNLTATLTGNTNVTFPTSGTLATTTGLASYTPDATGTVAMAVNTGYVCNAAGLTTLTLPTTAAVGQRVAVVGQGAGGWIIAQNAGESIHVVAAVTTVGVGGSLASTNRYDTVQLVCVVANNEWVAEAVVSAGLTVV